MRKNKVLKIVGQRRSLLRDLKAKRRVLGKLSEQVITLESDLSETDGVTIFNGFPVKVINVDRDIVEVWSGCEEVFRYAVLEPKDEDSWDVLAYHSTAEKDEDFGAVANGVTKKAALQAAKEFVSTGRVGGAKRKVGRPRKQTV
jgi:hypothetical protein